MTNYLELEIGERRDEIHRLSKCLPDLTGEDADWTIQGIREELEKFREFVERRGRYLTTAKVIDAVCDRCKAGEERTDRGHPVFLTAKGDESPKQIGMIKCPSQALWNALEEIIAKGERDDVQYHVG